MTWVTCLLDAPSARVDRGDCMANRGERTWQATSLVEEAAPLPPGQDSDRRQLWSAHFLAAEPVQPATTGSGQRGRPQTQARPRGLFLASFRNSTTACCLSIYSVR